MALPLATAQKTSGNRRKGKGKKNGANKKRTPAALLKGRGSKKRLPNNRKK